MTWFKVDDGFHSHPKALAASDAAVGLWARAGAWSGASLTDGFVPDYVLPRLSVDGPTLAKELVTVGLWKRIKGGYQFHDWHDMNPTAEDVKAERKATAERQRKWRQQKKQRGQDTSRNGVTNALVTRESRVASRVSNTAPSRPVPTRTYRDLVEGGYVGNARDSPPPRKCSKHENDPDPPNCGACADARREHDTWQTEHAEQLEAQRLADIVRVRACPHCDADGWAYEPGTRRPQIPYVRCAHPEAS